MLRFRPEQLAAFERAAFERFVRIAAADLREQYPDRYESRTDEALAPHVRAVIGRAAGYGLTSEFAVLQFAHIPELLGPDFDRRPECGDVVDALSRPGEQNARAEAARGLAREVRGLLDRMAQP